MRRCLQLPAVQLSVDPDDVDALMASLHSNADSGTDVDALMASLHSNDDSGTDMDLDILPSAAAGIAAAPPPSAADGAAAAAGGEFWDVFERRAAGAAAAAPPPPPATDVEMGGPPSAAAAAVPPPPPPSGDDDGVYEAIAAAAVSEDWLMWELDGDDLFFDDAGDAHVVPPAAIGDAAVAPPAAAAAAGVPAAAAPAHIPLPTTTISLHHDEPAVVPHSAAAVPCSATAAVDLTDFNKVNDVLLANMGGIDGLLAAPAVPATAVAFDTLRSDDASNTLALLPAACDADGADAASPACDAPLADGADASPLSPTAVQLRLWRPTFVKGTAEPPMPLATREEYRAEAAVMGAAIAAAQALERQAKAAAAAVPLGATKKAAAAAKRAAKAAAVEVVNVRGKLSALLRAV